MRIINYTNKFKRDYKLMQKRGHDVRLLDNVIRMLAKEEKLPEKYKDHALTGNFIGFRECHIKPDWLLIYLVEDDIVTLTLSRTGTHSDLFKN